MHTRLVRTTLGPGSGICAEGIFRFSIYRFDMFDELPNSPFRWNVFDPCEWKDSHYCSLDLNALLTEQVVLVALYFAPPLEESLSLWRATGLARVIVVHQNREPKCSGFIENV